jgi:hypothetical protein
MAASSKLQGLDLIDCAKANAKQGIEAAALLCGYQTDLSRFQQQLQQACQQIGVEVFELSDLITDHPAIGQEHGIEIAPDTASDL